MEIVIDFERNITVSKLLIFFFNVRLSDHGLYHASFLMRSEGFFIEFSSTIVALYKSLFHKSVKSAVIELNNVLSCDSVFREQLIHSWGNLGTWTTKFRGFMILLVFPFLLAGLDVNAKRFGTKLTSANGTN